MIIRNLREQKFSGLQSFVTNNFVEPVEPKMKQVHGNRVVIITSPEQFVGEADGMVTQLKNIELQVRVADCGNIYAYDPIAKVIGVCHSGRQGTHKNIIYNVIESMKILGSQPQDIVIRTGPCISGKNYQFGEEVKELFDMQYYTFNGEYYYLNLPKVHHDQLILSGILPKNIVQSDICTFDTIELPSYRRQGPDSGRITGSIMQVC